MRKIGLFLFVISTVLVIYGCGGTNSLAPAANTSTVKEVLIDHFGYDFSSQIATGDMSLMDGHTIAWCPVSQNASYANYDQYIWYRNEFFNSPNYTTQIRDYGAVSLNTITSGPVTWNADPINPLFVGHSYVAKCQDGYVAFEVEAIGSANIPEATTMNFWPIKVKYKYSTSINF